ncbi:hypothetical protein MTO96_049497 [Rhipicephalus appendiculatus]
MNKDLTANYVASKNSTVAFFGSGNDGRNVLFSATVSDGRPLGYRLFPMSARVLDSSGSFTLLSHARAASLDAANGLKSSEALYFIYGFSNNGFAYFIELRKVLSRSQYSLETWLLRVCENGESPFRAHVEVPITCRAQNAVLSLATSAHLEPPMYTRGGGGSNTTRVLAVTFATPSAIMENFTQNLSISAVCFFDMNDVEVAFRNTVKNCHTSFLRTRLSRLYSDKGGGFQCYYGNETRLLVSLDAWSVGSEISSSTALDSNGAYGYFLIGNKVARIPVGSCKIYGTCSKCIKSQDPLRCGWCGDHCAHFAECTDREKFTVELCPMELERVYPLNGPVSGGSVITILGDNLGSPNRKPYSSVEVLIGNRTCVIVYWNPKR